MNLWIDRIETAQVRRIWNACDLTGKMRTVSLIWGPSGCSKTTAVKWYCEQRRWPIPVGEALMKIQSDEKFDFERTLDVLEDLGVFRMPTRKEDHTWLHAKFYEETCRHTFAYRLDSLDLNDRSAEYRSISREQLAAWAKEYAAVRGLPDPDPVNLLKDLGIVEERTPLQPEYFRAQSLMTPPFLLAEFMRRLCNGERPWGVAERFYRVQDVLKRVRLLVIMDEVEILKPPAIDFLRDLHDVCNVPLVLLGTSALKERLRHTPSLRPLASRVGLSLEVRPTTPAELGQALPELDAKIMERVYVRSSNRSGCNLHVVQAILKGLQDAIERQPRRRLTVKLVDDIADMLPRAMEAGALEYEDIEPAVGEEAPGEGSRAAVRGVLHKPAVASKPEIRRDQGEAPAKIASGRRATG